MDIWEANKEATALTPHTCNITGLYECQGSLCSFNGSCDQWGCSYNPYNNGNHGYYGPGLQVDTSKPFTVVTQFPARAPVLDAKGTPLQVPAPAYVLGVWPARLFSQAATAQAFARLTSLQAGQVLGQIAAAPPDQFLRLATLDPATYASLRSDLRAVPGLVIRPESQRLFQAEATALVGGVGSAVNEPAPSSSLSLQARSRSRECR